jgi:hypothetical protein
MASCHIHAAIIHIHRRVWHPAIPTLPSFTYSPPIIPTYSVSGVRGYGRMPYPPKLPFCFGVRDAGVINRLETLDEHELGEGEVAERDRTLLEEALVDIAVDDAVDERRDALLRVLHERARSCLNAISNHKDGLFACERVRTRVLELRYIHLLVGMFVLILYIEILRSTTTVVREDEVADERRRWLPVRSSTLSPWATSQQR